MSNQKKLRKSMVSTSHMTRRKTNRVLTTQQINCKDLQNIKLRKQPLKWNQSASTWRHSSPKHTFPKEKRFKNYKASHLDILTIQRPSTSSGLYSTLGKGQKQPISTILLRNAKQIPSPDSYNLNILNSSVRTRKKGYSFCSNWKSQQKVFLPHRKDNYSYHFTIDNPSAKYQIRQKPGKNSLKFTAYQKLKTYTEKIGIMKRHIPGPNIHKIKDRHLYLMIGLNQRSFGFGQRLDLSKPANNNPGPKYNISSFCETIS